MRQIGVPIMWTKTCADALPVVGDTVVDRSQAVTLDERLQRFDPQRHGGEVMGGQSDLCPTYVGAPDTLQASLVQECQHQSQRLHQNPQEPGVLRLTEAAAAETDGWDSAAQ